MNPELEQIRDQALEINEQANTIATEQGKATQSFDADGNRSVQRPSANNVPMSDLATQGQSVEMPTPTMPQDGVRSTLGAANGVLTDLQTQTQEKEAQAGQVLSDSDRRIREAMGMLSTQEDTRQDLEETAGVDQFSQDLQKFQQSLRQQVAQLDQFDVDNVNTIEQMRVDASKRDITKRTFNAMSAEANIQNAVQRANMVAQTRATIAAIDVTQGNLQQATQQVDKALKSIYEPVRMGLEMEMFFNERNFQQFTAAQQESSNARMMSVQRELQEIDRAEDMVNNVVANGYARPDEIAQLVGLSGSPRQQKALAQTIANRGAAEMRGLEMQNLSLQIAKNRASLEGLGQPDANSMLVQSLFGQGQPEISFQEFLAEKGMDNMSFAPDMQAQLEQEYQATFAADPSQKQNTLNYLVATGAVNPQTAQYLQQNLDITSPQQQAKQSMVVNRGKTVLRDVDRALTEVEKAGPIAGFVAEGTRMFGTGPSLAARVSPAFELQQHLASIKSNISIDQLQAMRDASPTGGALGQVPVQQQEFLMSVLGSLNPSLQPTVLQENLNDVYNVYLDTMFGSPEELAGAVKSGKLTPTEANGYLQQRKETGFNEYNLPTNRSNGEDIGNLVVSPTGDLVIVE